MRQGLTKLVVVSAVLLASAPAWAIADSSPRLAVRAGNLAASKGVRSAPGARRPGFASLVRSAPTDRAWPAIVLGFGLLGALGRRPASPFEEQFWGSRCSICFAALQTQQELQRDAQSRL